MIASRLRLLRSARHLRLRQLVAQIARRLPERSPRAVSWRESTSGSSCRGNTTATAMYRVHRRTDDVSSGGTTVGS